MSVVTIGPVVTLVKLVSMVKTIWLVADPPALETSTAYPPPLVACTPLRFRLELVWLSRLAPLKSHW